MTTSLTLENAVEESCVLDVKVWNSADYFFRSYSCIQLFFKGQVSVLQLKVAKILSLWISAKDLNISVQFRQLIIFLFSSSIVFLWSPTWRLFSKSSRQHQNFSRHGALSGRSLEGCYIPSRSLVVRNII